MATDRLQQSGPSKPRYNVIDLFAGVGGLTLGFLDASNESRCSFVPRLMVDKDPEARIVANRNLPSVAYLVADVHTLAGPDLRDCAKMGPHDLVHVLVGGPPCQGFSWLGRRALDDERNLCVVDFLNAVKDLRPLVVLMENVPLIMASHGGSIVNEVIESLSRFGYNSQADTLVASDYGVPQLRKRAVVIAYREDIGVVPDFPPKTFERVAFATESRTDDDAKARFDPSKRPYISVEEAIGDLPTLEAGEGAEVLFYRDAPTNDYQHWARAGSPAIFNHRSRAHGKEFLEKISIIREGGRENDLPPGQRFADNYFSQAYARLHRHGIAQTITTSFGNPGSGRFMHYRELRSITVREAARFQSFPDAFIFEGHHATQMRHVGNAVPPLMARALRDQIARDLLAAGVTGGDVPKRRQKLRPRDDPGQRSKTMRAVPSVDSKPEMLLRKALWAEGLRGYRLHSKEAPGKPDVLFPVERLVIFLDGCFWHGCPKCYRAPHSSTEYWSMKVGRNRQRDRLVNADCEAAGWRVFRVWEHEVKDDGVAVAKKIERTLARLRRKLA